MGVGARGAAAGAGAVADATVERTMGRVAGNSVSDERRRGRAAGTMGVAVDRPIGALW